MLFLPKKGSKSWLGSRLKLLSVEFIDGSSGACEFPQMSSVKKNHSVLIKIAALCFRFSFTFPSYKLKGLFLCAIFPLSLWIRLLFRKFSESVGLGRANQHFFCMSVQKVNVLCWQNCNPSKLMEQTRAIKHSLLEWSNHTWDVMRTRKRTLWVGSVKRLIILKTGYENNAITSYCL